jgi:thioredoxin 1
MSELILTDDNFEAEVLKSNVPVLVDFFAVWCGPCQMQGPIVDELAEEFSGEAGSGSAGKDKKIKIAKLDVDQAPKTAEKYDVMSIPTLIIFKQGEVAEKMVGMRTKDDLKASLEKVI